MTNNSHKKLNVAVVGLGNMGQHHVRINAQLDQTQLVAVCDSDNERVTTFSTEYNCVAYTDFNDLLEAESLDIVTIATSTKSHFPLAKLAIEKGVNVFIEKPIATSLEEGETLIDLAKRNGVKIMVGHIERYNPAVQKLNEMIQAGELGTVKTIVSRRLGPFPNQIKDADVIIDLAVHDIDICTSLLNESPSHITAESGQAIIDDRPDYSNIFMTFKHASSFTQVSWISPIRIRELLVTGSKGYARLDFINQAIEFYPSDYTAKKNDQNIWDVSFNPSEKVDIEIEKKEPLKEEIAHFVNAVLSGHSPLTDGQVGLNALTLALKAKAS